MMNFIKGLKSVFFIVCFLSMLYISAQAEKTNFELYSIEVGKEKCLISGRSFVKANCDVTLTTERKNDASAFPTEFTTVCAGDGSFEFEFDAEAGIYGICIETEDKTIVQEIDFSDGREILEISDGYQIDSVCVESEAITLRGSHTGMANADVVLMVTEKSEEGGLGNAKALEQTKSDENGNFEFKFKLKPGEYTLYLEAGGIKGATVDFTIGNNMELLTASENEFKGFLKKLDSYVRELSAMTEKCELRGITTDYESADCEIIKKFTDYIKNEALNNDYSRMGQYNYSLTRIYNKALENMQMYLNGEKTAFSVPRYVTGEVKNDGTTLLATTRNGDVIEERPVFFVGYGHWGTAGEEIPFFSKIGANITTSAVYMSDVIKEINAEGWNYVNNGECPIEIEITKEAFASGAYSAKLVNPEKEVSERYACLSQTVDVKPDTTYVFGVTAKGDGAEVWLSMEGFGNASGRGYLEDTTDWKKYLFEYTSGADAVKGYFTLYTNGQIDELYLDDFYVKEKGAEENLLENSGFETAGREMTREEQEAAENGWYVDRGEFNRLRGIFESAEDNDVLVTGAVNVSMVPEFVINSDPEITEASAKYLPYSIDHPTIRNILSVYGRMYADVADDYASVHDLMIMNEPKVHCNDGVHYVDGWHKYLEDKYMTIGNLNEIYGSRYTDFKDVKMPNGTEKTPRYYDYRSFNDSVLSEFIIWFANELKTEYPDFNYHVKMMQYLRTNYPNYFRDGTNYESVAESLDLNGCDAFNTFGDVDAFLMKMAWYDMMTSLADKPVWDTESHILADKAEAEYDDLMPLYTAADVWNGAVHGRGGCIIWTWDDSKASMPWGNSQFVNSNFVFRPAEVAEISKTTLDLNRLSKELAAIQKQAPEVGILYSRTSIGYNDNHMSMVNDAYKQTIFSGQKVGFITDSNSGDVDKYRLLLVPEATHVSADVIENIYTFMQSGGKVVLMGSDSLKYDENNSAHTGEMIDYILANADSARTPSEKINEMEMSEVVLIDTKTGKKPENVEWSYAVYNGKYVINILNYDMENSKTVQIIQNGQEVNTVRELRSGAVSDTLKANPMEPMLVSIDKPQYTFNLVDENGEIIEKNIDVLRQGKIKCNTKADGSLILTLYKDSVLIDVSIGTGEIEFLQSDSGHYELTAMAWDMTALIPLAEKQSIACNK